jgi:hypothetical protein
MKPWFKIILFTCHKISLEYLDMLSDSFPSNNYFPNNTYLRFQYLEPSWTSQGVTFP